MAKQGPFSLYLVDDHSVVRAGIRQFLENDPDLQVIGEAGNGLEALQQVRKLAPDLVLLDIQLPGMNGIEVVRSLRQEDCPARFLILSAFDDLPYIQAALRAGADGYVIKTDPPAEIIASVHRVLSGQRALSGTIQETLDRLDRGPLSARELEVLALAADGLSNGQIASRLGLSGRTVQNHLAHIFHSLEASSRTEAVMKAIGIGLIAPPGAKGAG